MREVVVVLKLVGTLVLIVALAGCAGQSAQQGSPPVPGGAPPQGGGAPVTAVATVFPLAWMTDQVAPEADVTFVGQGAAELHDLELSPQDRVAVEQADVVVHMGDIGYQPQVVEAAGASSGQVVSVAETVGPQALIAGTGDEHEHEHAEEGGSEPAAEAGGAPEGAAEEEAIDPHVWFDAGLMATVAERIGEAFAAADPAGAQGYRDNAANLANQLRDLDGEIAGMLANCQVDEAIVSHEAYAYLLQPNGLSQHGIAGVNPESGGSPAELAELTREIQAEGIPAVLAEPVEGRGDAEALAREADVELLEINPLEGVDEQGYQTGYPQLLQDQAATFAQALQCGGASE